jgi:hypothetical protein
MGHAVWVVVRCFTGARGKVPFVVLVHVAIEGVVEGTIEELVKSWIVGLPKLAIKRHPGRQLEVRIRDRLGVPVPIKQRASVVSIESGS